MHREGTLVSVVIPSYRTPALPQALRALAPQLGPAREAVVVESSGDGTAAAIRREFPWARVLELPERCLPGRARNLGAEAAAGRRLAFLDADTIPQPGWLDALERRLVPGVALVVGAVGNGTPRSPTGTAGFLLEFLDWVPPQPPLATHGASCSMLVSRETFERAGGFPEDVWPAEDTLFSRSVARYGLLAFAPDAQVLHLNRRGLRALVAHQRRLGASFAVAAARQEIPGRMFATPPLLFAAGPARLASLARRLVGHRREALQAVAVAPLLVLGLAAWNLGAYDSRRRRAWAT